MNNDSPQFATVTDFDGEEATITLSGTVTSGAAFQLGAVLDAAIELEPASVVLDAAELEFIGQAGLLAISSAEMRLVASGSKLSLRSPSALVNRLLDIMELAESARLDGAAHGRSHLGPEQRGEMPAVLRHSRVDTSTEDFRQVTALPVDPEVIDGALRLVVDLARVSVRGADGVSVSLLRGGVLSTVAASDRTIMTMDADQYATGEGPCVDASLQGRWFHAESLESETRWPSFTPQARALGIKAILSSPLKALEEPVGALNIYSRMAATFDVRGQEVAAGFADRASVILSDARAGVGETQMAVRFQEALRTREIITLAKGIIMEREGIDEDAAFTALLRLALDGGAPLRRRAEEMLLSTKQPELGLRWGLDE